MNSVTPHPPANDPQSPLVHPHHGFTNAIVRTFLYSHLSLIFMLLAVVIGAAALLLTPREEDPQIVVPLADIHVSFPGHGAEDVERLVATPLEKLLYQIDGVEYVYSMSRPDHAIVTVRFYVGEDRERSLVKLYKRIDEHLDWVPPGVTGWVVKPVEIDDVPIVTLTLRGSDPPDAPTGATTAGPDEFALRRVAEELAERLAAVENVSRAYAVGGAPRRVQVYLDAERMAAFGVAPLDVQRALRGADAMQTAGDFTRDDRVIRVEAGRAFVRHDELNELVVAVHDGRPVYLKDVATIVDGPAEIDSYVRHGWGPALGFASHAGATGTRVDGHEPVAARESHAPAADGASHAPASSPAVTLALAKKKGSNAVWVARDVLAAAAELKQEIVPDNIDLIVTRNYGLTADEKVNELIEALAVALVIVMALLTLGMGWREAAIVAVAVPVVFGLTLGVNLLFGFTINRVTLFALILSLGLLVDDPIVDVENISRHFTMRRRASRPIVMEAVAEIRPPLITATLAVIVSFLPMFFITGMMGPYMRPMALNVPVAMLMSMAVAFTITPWLAYHVLKRGSGGDADGGRSEHGTREQGTENSDKQQTAVGADPHDVDPEALRRSALYRFFHPLMAPLLGSRRRAWAFIGVMALLTLAAAGLAAVRGVPLKMLPFDNKNELTLVLDFDEGTTLERADAVVRDFERFLSAVPEATDFTSYVGLASPMDFNGLVRHYYLRRGPNVADIRVNLAPKKNRRLQSHAVGLRMRDELTALATHNGARLKIVETPPGPPVISTIVAEIYGRPDNAYADLLAAAESVRSRLAAEPGVVDVDDIVEAPRNKLVFVTDKEKAALHGVTTADVVDTLRLALSGVEAATIRATDERQPLRIELRLPRATRSSPDDLARIHVRGATGGMTPLSELGRWENATVDQTIYHKNLQRVAYVFAEAAGRPPADCIVDIQADRAAAASHTAATTTTAAGAPAVRQLRQTTAPAPRPVAGRTFLSNGGGIPWSVSDGIRVDFAGEGEWQITLDVFRDLGLAFGAAMLGIYILLVAQTGSFVIPIIVMLAIPLTVLGIMPGFWLLNALTGGDVGGYADPVFFTATGMIGMIALAGIVTRDSIILVDFIHLSLARGRSLFDAIMESRVVRLRPILLTSATAMLSAIPIAIDPIFSGLAWALIFGLLASTVFTLFVIPVAYWLLYEHKPRHGLPESPA